MTIKEEEHAKQFAQRQAQAARDDLEGERRTMQAELEAVRSNLDEALGSIGCLTSDKRKLSEQVLELVAKFKQTQAELEKANKDASLAKNLKDLADAERARIQAEADAHVKKIQDESIRERTMLVQAALRSLQELRTRAEPPPTKGETGT